MLKHVRKAAWPVVAFAAGALIVPTVAYAATGSFSSSTATPAVTATNSSTGLAVSAASKGTTVRSDSSGTTAGSAGLFRQYSTGSLSNGVFARAYATTGTHYGAWGVDSAPGGAGIRGEGRNAAGGDGVQGIAAGATANGVSGTNANGTGVLGDGAVGVAGLQGDPSGFGVVSAGDFGNGGNAYDVGGGWAGTCQVASGQGSAACTFTLPFLDPSVSPVVVVTPQGNPGSAYWVSGASATGFTVNLAAPAPANVVFGFQVVGVLPATASAQSADGKSKVRSLDRAGKSAQR